MQKNENLAKSIADSSWGDFFRKLKYKAEWYRRDLLEINRWFPSSKRCSCCGHINRLLSKFHSIVKWVLFGIFSAKFLGHMYAYGLKIYHKICPKTAPFSNQSEFRKKSNNRLRLSDRIWECSSCKAMLERDINAAKNILTVGLAELAFGESGRLGIENSMQSCSL